MLLDTSGLLCLFDRDDFRHEQAIRLFEGATRLLTHSYVLAEFVPLCQSRAFPRRESLAFVVDMLSSPEIDIVWVDEMLSRSALALLNARMDKTYSMCDAVSFVLMRDRGVTEALTTDHHFDQEGLQRLLEP